MLGLTLRSQSWSLCSFSAFWVLPLVWHRAIYLYLYSNPSLYLACCAGPYVTQPTLISVLLLFVWTVPFNLSDFVCWAISSLYVQNELFSPNPSYRASLKASCICRWQHCPCRRNIIPCTQNLMITSIKSLWRNKRSGSCNVGELFVLCNCYWICFFNVTLFYFSGEGGLFFFFLI